MNIDPSTMGTIVARDVVSSLSRLELEAKFSVHHCTAESHLLMSYSSFNASAHVTPSSVPQAFNQYPHRGRLLDSTWHFKFNLSSL